MKIVELSTVGFDSGTEIERYMEQLSNYYSYPYFGN